MPNPVIDFPWDKANVTGTGTVVGRPCVVHTITLNGCTTLGSVDVYDALDATVPATRIATYTLLGASASYQGISFLYDCEMTTGIHMVFTAFVGDFTVTFK
ncbi:unnamed protein product [marine sediment metagenome]|uniref:Uncharacterized protein n=1 Tax=marine sediment metagenome TaxID=412755 RepID=X1BCS1_9ZZZZ